MQCNTGNALANQIRAMQYITMKCNISQLDAILYDAMQYIMQRNASFNASLWAVGVSKWIGWLPVGWLVCGRLVFEKTLLG